MEKLIEYSRVFIRQIKAMFWYVFRYIAMGAALSIACLSFVTGEFPPPIAKYYGQIKNFRESMNIIQQMQGAAGNQEVKKEAMYELERVRQELNPNGQIPTNPMAKTPEKPEEKVVPEFQTRLSSTESELMEIRKRVVQTEKQITEQQKLIAEQQKQIDELKARPAAQVLAHAPAPTQPQPQVQQKPQIQPPAQQVQMPTPAKVTALPSNARVPAATPTPTATPVPPSKFGAIPTTLPPKATPAQTVVQIPQAPKPVAAATPTPSPAPAAKTYYTEPRAAPNTRLPLPPTQQPMGQPTSSN